MSKPALNWRKWTPETKVFDGDFIVAAVHVRQLLNATKSWDIAVLKIQCDEESNAILCDDNDWSWALEDIEWWFPLAELLATLPKEKA